MVAEAGSDLATVLWENADLSVSSVLAYPEGRAALAAAHRSGRLDEEPYRRSLADFEELHEELATVGVDEQLARAAGDHAEAYGLRGYDAVHLATALDLGDEELVVVTWDEDLGRAAADAGLTVAGAALP